MAIFFLIWELAIWGSQSNILPCCKTLKYIYICSLPNFFLVFGAACGVKSNTMASQRKPRILKPCLTINMT